MPLSFFWLPLSHHYFKYLQPPHMPHGPTICGNRPTTVDRCKNDLGCLHPIIYTNVIWRVPFCHGGYFQSSSILDWDFPFSINWKPSHIAQTMILGWLAPPRSGMIEWPEFLFLMSKNAWGPQGGPGDLPQWRIGWHRGDGAMTVGWEFLAGNEETSMCKWRTGFCCTACWW